MILKWRRGAIAEFFFLCFGFWCVGFEGLIQWQRCLFWRVSCIFGFVS